MTISCDIPAVSGKMASHVPVQILCRATEIEGGIRREDAVYSPSTMLPRVSHMINAKKIVVQHVENGISTV